jgi:glucose-6-phosphate 1-dehydrogenase
MASDEQDRGALGLGVSSVALLLGEDQAISTGKSGHAPSDPHAIVLFGATGDLAKRKLLPGLFDLSWAGMLPDCHIVATSLELLDDSEYHRIARLGWDEVVWGELTDEHWEGFQQRIVSVSGEHGGRGLAETVERLEATFDFEPRRLRYLSIPPRPPTRWCGPWGETGLTDQARIIMEKPFGTDLTSACHLNALVGEVFDDGQVFRIDHFPGKEVAQNILVFRFADVLFEPIWNLQHIDHIQIDVLDTLGVEPRTAFYEQTDAYRNMVVTHLLQVLAFVAMEPPTELEPRSIDEQKNKVFQLRPIDLRNVVRGQHEG